MRDTLGFENITKKIENSLIQELNKCGLMYRMFSRVKTPESILNKVLKKEYKKNGKKITDIIGIRITLYFQDDVDLVHKILKDKNNFDHESTDSFSIDEFKPIRCNLTFNLQEEFIKEAKIIISPDFDIIDTKYEIQIRTVLSEGWHEVEHDLRYKCKDDWNGHDDLNRNLNGIFATLETSEFSMLQMLNNLAHRHYKAKNINALFKIKFRIKFKDNILNPKIKELLLTDNELLKKIYKIDRIKFLSKFYSSKITLPLTMDNFIFLLNFIEVKDDRIHAMASEFVKSELELH
jgi:putative GTP pyrophosphokinase